MTATKMQKGRTVLYRINKQLQLTDVFSRYCIRLYVWSKHSNDLAKLYSVLRYVSPSAFL